MKMCIELNTEVLQTIFTVSICHLFYFKSISRFKKWKKNINFTQQPRELIFTKTSSASSDVLTAYTSLYIDNVSIHEAVC